MHSSESTNLTRKLNKNFCVKLEHIKTSLQKIRPEDPVKTRTRLTLMKSGFNSYRILGIPSNETHKCKYCSKSFGNDRYSLLRHYSVKHFKDLMMKFVKGNDLKCQFCGLSKSNISALIGHIGAKHKKVLDVFVDTMDFSKCMICSKEFNRDRSDRYSALRHYSYTHFKDKIMKYVKNGVMKCQFCGQPHKNLSMLLGHLGAKHKKIHEVLLNNLDETEEKQCYSDQPNRPNGKMECGFCPQNFSG